MERIPKLGDFDVDLKGSMIEVSVARNGSSVEALLGEWVSGLETRLSKRLRNRAPGIRLIRVTPDRIGLFSFTPVRAKKAPGSRNRGLINALRAEIRREIRSFVGRLKFKRPFAPKRGHEKQTRRRHTPHFSPHLAHVRR